jgi:TonB family protein
MRAVQRSIAIASLMLIFSGVTVFGQSGRKVVNNPEPVYPELAKRMHLTGVVKVLVTIGPEGQIKNMEFQGGHPVLIDAVQTALKQWKFAPASSESKAVLEFKF